MNWPFDRMELVAGLILAVLIFAAVFSLLLPIPLP
jgi:hypothetical protein